MTIIISNDTFIHVAFVLTKGSTSWKMDNFVQEQIKYQLDFSLSLVSGKYFTSLVYFCEKQVLQSYKDTVVQSLNTVLNFYSQ